MTSVTRRSPPGIEVRTGSQDSFTLLHAVFDFNGTLATDGRLIVEVPALLTDLSEKVEIHVATADTFGTAKRALERLPVNLHVINGENDKARLVQSLGSGSVVTVGNGRNDAAMLACSAFSILVIGEEGAWAKNFDAARVVVSHIHDAFGLLLNPKRFTATLRK